MRSGARPAPRLAGEVTAKLWHGDAGDGAPVEVVTDQLLNVGHAEVATLAAHLNQQFLDAGVMAVVLGPGQARGLNFGQKLIHHVAHLPIIGDSQSRHQVMPGFMLARHNTESWQASTSV